MKSRFYGFKNKSHTFRDVFFVCKLIGVILFTNACKSTLTSQSKTIAPLELSMSNSAGGAILVSPSGVSCTTTCTESFATGTLVTLTASPSDGYTFTSWNGACTGSTTTCTITMNTIKNVTATYTLTGSQNISNDTLTVSASTGGAVTSSPSGINCGSSCSASYASGTSIILTATPTAGYTFTSWGGACSGSTTTCSVTMSAAKGVTATFTPTVVNYALTVTAPTGGAVTSSPSGINCGSTCSASYATGTSVVLTAAPTAGYTFAGWSGACSGSTTTCSVTMSAVKSVTATFALTAVNYALTVTAPTGGTITSSPSGINCGSTCSASYASGTSIILTATPTAGYTFTSWGGACSGSTTTCTVTMSAAKTATAAFASTNACVQNASSTQLASVITNGIVDATATASAGGLKSYTMTTDTYTNFFTYSNQHTCPIETSTGYVMGICYGNYMIMPNIYGVWWVMPPNTSMSVWSNSASCWGVNVIAPALYFSDPNNPTSPTYWNAPVSTRGFSQGPLAKLTPSGGIKVSNLNTTYAGTTASNRCPSTGTAGSACVKWSMNVPGVSSGSAANNITSTYTDWDALIDIYFHDVAVPAAKQLATFDLQIYQMVMDKYSSGQPNWAAFIIGTHTTKTISGITYLVSVNMGDPGSEGAGWVGRGGTYNVISLIPLPTYPTTLPLGTGSYLWGVSSAVHDVGGIISWISKTETKNGVTGIFDDVGNLLYDNARHVNVTTPLLDPTHYLTGFNPGFEVILATQNALYPNNNVFTTTDMWVALPGEAVGN